MCLKYRDQGLFYVGCKGDIPMYIDLILSMFKIVCIRAGMYFYNFLTNFSHCLTVAVYDLNFHLSLQ